MSTLLTASSQVSVTPGPLLLSGAEDGPHLEAHRARWGETPTYSADELAALAAAADVRGRGGAGFPLARKIAAARDAAGVTHRPVVVVNAAEGEPASAKDSALLRRAPHLVLDGAVTLARALRARDVHVVTASDRPFNAAALEAALAARTGDRVRWRRHVAAPRFVSGQAQAVLELLAGRPGLPVTAWVPEAVRGYRGRPTLLANAETLAQLAVLSRIGSEAYGALGTPAEPGTTLLTVAGPPGPGGLLPRPVVVEAAHGSSLLGATGIAAHGPVLLGGFHGAWVPREQLAALTVSRVGLRERGFTLGAGVVLALPPHVCPVALTARIVGYLAGESAGRCGPCRLGLPALATEVALLADGVDSRPRVVELVGTVDGRGACAHPDGTARLVRSLLALPGEVEQHLVGGCACTPNVAGASDREPAGWSGR